MELIDGMAKVEKMIEKYEEKKCLGLTVTKEKDKFSLGIITL